MITDAVDSQIERRLLVNYRIDADRVAALLPAPFRPQLQRGWAVGGVCLIRLGELRLPHVPRVLGLRTENMAHRFAVEWGDDGERQVGVYVPRRDTSSRISAWAGGKVFSGAYELARFSADDQRSSLRITVTGTGGTTLVAVTAHEVLEMGGELFSSLEEALDFFQRGARSFSPGWRRGAVDAVRLESGPWQARPVSIDGMSSSLFDDEELFPPGSCVLDSGLVMREIEARWVSEAGRGPTHERDAAAASTGKAQAQC